MTIPMMVEAHDGAAPPGYTCNAVKRQQNGASVELCTQRAGWGTDHPGVGRCKLHGGASPVRHGLYSGVTAHRLSSRLGQLRANEEQLLDLREQIALQAAVVQEYVAGLDSGASLSAEKAKLLAGLVEAVSKNIERFHKIEQGQALGPAEIRIVLAQVVTIVRRETDGDTAARIGRRLLAQLDTNDDAA